MTRRILAAAILIPFVLASLLVFPLPVFLVVLTGLLFLASREFSKLASASGSTFYAVSYILALTAPWIVNYAPNLVWTWTVIAVLATLSWCVFSTADVNEAFQRVAGNILGLCYLTIPFTLMATFHPASPPCRKDPGRPFELVFVLLIVWAGDAAALFIGRALGRHRLTPAISPNKTLAGFLAAIIFPVGSALLIGRYFVPDKSYLFLVSAGLIIAAASIVGDLFESILKRGAGIKDTSDLIPGHGGVLDRIDSLLFALPAYHLLAVMTS